MCFSIYADFLNVRKEERLYSMIRPQTSVNYEDKRASIFLNSKNESSEEKKNCKYLQLYQQNLYDENSQEAQEEKVKEYISQSFADYE